VLERPGGHSWTVWTPALVEILQAIPSVQPGASDPASAR
jgi:enterochelin esterase-like enzyme